jgi:hypothetical protein
MAGQTIASLGLSPEYGHVIGVAISSFIFVTYLGFKGGCEVRVSPLALTA